MNVYVVYCHPTHESLVGAALDRTLAGLAAAGHEIRLTDLYLDGFEPELTLDEHRSNSTARPHHELSPLLQSYVDNLRWADTLVFVYPTWWAAQPAMLKGWFDRVWMKGVAFDLPEGADRIRPLLSNVRRIIAVTTHGSSKFVNAIEGEPGKRTLSRSIRVCCNWRCRTEWIALYRVDRSTPEGRDDFLARVERRFARL